MIITKVVKLKMNNKIISHYKKLGYDVETNKELDIKVVDLTSGSHSLIIAECDICKEKKEVSYKEYNRNTKKYNIFCCCNKCATIKSKKTSVEKYGVDHFSKTPEFVDKIKETNLSKYGVEYYTQTDEYKEIMLKHINNYDYDDIKNKSIKTSLSKYGTENYHKSKKYILNKNNIIEKYKNTITKKLLKKYDNLISTDNKNYTFLCKNNHEFQISRELLKNRIKINTEMCTVCNPIGSSKSGYEIQLYDFITNNTSHSILKNNRICLDNKYELDIYIPELKLAFEFNGLYWHNEINKENNYHLNKTEECEKKDIHLIHIYEDDWLYKQDIIKSMILNKLNRITNKIYARKCNIKEIDDNKLIRKFLEKNHIQGFVGSKIKIGLFYDNELISLMTFGDRRVAMGKKSTKEKEHELLRFCNKLNINVVGGASKLFKYFINKYNPSEITTYSDRSYSKGNLYNQLGFNYIGKTGSNYYYIIDNIRCNRFNFRKDLLVKKGYDKSKSEHQIMIERKIYRIYDSGNLNFIYKNS